MEQTQGDWQVVDHAWRDKELPFDEIIFVETSQDVVAQTWNRANANLISASPELYKELLEADRVICELCKRLNPQHATADHGKGCNWCQDRETRLNALTKAQGRAR